MGAWIEIVLYGVKFSSVGSHPTMGAWIEIKAVQVIIIAIRSHPTMGAWIEIKKVWSYKVIKKGRTPRWVRGLKSAVVSERFKYTRVAPHDGCVD